jgi:hypothetical protein
MQFSFHDSEVRSCTSQAATLAIVFSAAFVQLPDGRIGYLQPLRMELHGSAWSGPLAECMGRVSEGRLWDGVLQPSALPLPYASTGPVRLELRFSNGAYLEASAHSLVFQPNGGARFVESLAC